ncbi:MAG: lipoyl(octanoyl) transferase LipB [Chloroflexota bacterium]
MIEVEWLGRLDYQVAWQRQKDLVAEREGADGPAALPDKLLLLEHPPTYTLGRRGHLGNLLWDEAERKRRGIAVYWVDRGGDVTYHGPGQLVGYPILDLRRLHSEQRGLARPDLRLYLRQLEETLIRALAVFKVDAYRYPGYTGVWVETAAGPRKIAAIGVKVSGQGVTSHGFALNVAPDLSHFAGIVPCGIHEHGVTSLAEMIGEGLSITTVLPAVANAFRQTLGVEVRFVTPPHSTYNE